MPRHSLSPSSQSTAADDDDADGGLEESGEKFFQSTFNK